MFAGVDLQSLSAGQIIFYCLATKTTGIPAESAGSKLKSNDLKAKGYLK